MNNEYFKFKNSTNIITITILTLMIIFGISQVKAETQQSSMLPIFGHTNNSFLYKIRVEDRTCVLAEDQYNRGGRSLVCWPTTQK